MSEEILLHASCVVLSGRGVLLLGPAGSGKSALALSLMAFGADLCADDRTRVWREGRRLCAAAPETIRGLIEARGIGLLPARAVDCPDLVLAVDLGRLETARLPEERHLTLLGQAVPLRGRVEGPHLASAILQWLKAGGS